MRTKKGIKQTKHSDTQDKNQKTKTRKNIIFKN
jgi:hypothetical protein